MARFSQAFLQSLTQPSYGEGLFEFGKGLSMTPALIGAEEERKRKEKGLLGGLMQIQQAAQTGQLDPETARMAAGSLQGLGMPVEDIMSTLSNAQGIQQKAMEQQRQIDKEKRITEYFNSFDPKWAQQYSVGVAPAEILKGIKEETDVEGRIRIGETLDIPADIAAGMTSNELANRLDDKKEEGGAQKWAQWVKSNPNITDENRSEAIDAAYLAFGKDAPAKVADLELKQLQKKERDAKRNLKPVQVTLSSASVLSVPGMDSTSKIQKFDLAFNEDGTFTEATIKWLKAHAVHAFQPATGASWSTKDTTIIDDPSGNTSNATLTLGSLMAGRRP